jgi:hypothetical protein
LRRLGAGLLAVLLVALMLAGCQSQQTKPEFSFTAEQKGEGLTILVKTTNFRIGKDGHVHIRLDDGPETMAYGPSYTIPKVAPGKHTVIVGLYDPAHKPLGQDQTKEIEIK